ncbi:LysR substrate binding domain protein [compost metagenome]
MQVSSGSIVRQLCLAGIGVGRIGRFHVEPDFEAGTLVPLLEDYQSGEIETVYAVYAGHEHLAARIRAFIDFLVDRM